MLCFDRAKAESLQSRPSPIFDISYHQFRSWLVLTIDLHHFSWVYIISLNAPGKPIRLHSCNSGLNILHHDFPLKVLAKQVAPVFSKIILNGPQPPDAFNVCLLTNLRHALQTATGPHSSLSGALETSHSLPKKKLAKNSSLPNKSSRITLFRNFFWSF
jgi:hypothetical protein